MAHLVNCFECGAEVSSEAGECPKCNNPIYGYQCKICNISEKRINLKWYRYLHYKDIDSSVEFFYSLAHQKCIDNISKELSTQYTCPLCRKYSQYISIIEEA